MKKDRNKSKKASGSKFKSTELIEPTEEDLETISHTKGLSNRLRMLDQKYPVLDPSDF
jgi:hypothetical protein